MTIDTERLKTDAAYWDVVCDRPHSTHYCTMDDEFLDEKVHSIDTCCIPRPTKPSALEWNGEGLPPVGCECEYTFGMFQCPDSPIKKVKYIGQDHDNLVIKFLGEHEGSRFTSTSPSCVRPLRTAEQREREELMDILGQLHIEFHGDEGGGTFDVDVGPVADAIIKFYKERYNLEKKP